MLRADLDAARAKWIKEASFRVSEPAADMAKTAFEDTSQLYSGMGMFQHARAGSRFEQKSARRSLSRQLDWAQADARRNAPAPPDPIVPEYFRELIILAVVTRLRCTRRRLLHPPNHGIE